MMTDEIVREMVRKYDELLLSVLEPMSSGQVLCIHRIAIEPAEENMLRWGIKWHILEKDESCPLPGTVEQHRRR